MLERYELNDFVWRKNKNLVIGHKQKHLWVRSRMQALKIFMILFAV